MRFHVALAGMIWLLGLDSAAHAGEVGAGPIFHKNQAIASCAVVNFNARPVQITMQILSSDGSPVSITFNNCAGTQLRTDQVCVMNAKLSSQSILYFCKVGIEIPVRRATSERVSKPSRFAAPDCSAPPGRPFRFAPRLPARPFFAATLDLLDKVDRPALSRVEPIAVFAPGGPRSSRATVARKPRDDDNQERTIRDDTTPISRIG